MQTPCFLARSLNSGQRRSTCSQNKHNNNNANAKYLVIKATRKIPTHYNLLQQLLNPKPYTTPNQTRRAVFFLFIHYSHATNGDHGEIMYSPVPVRCPRIGSTLLAPLCPPPRPVPRRCGAHQRKYKGKEQMRRRIYRSSPLRRAP